MQMFKAQLCVVNVFVNLVLRYKFEAYSWG